MCSVKGNCKVCNSVIDDGKCYYTAREPYEGSTIRVYMDGRTAFMAPRYELIYHTAFGAYNGISCLAMSDTGSSNMPLLWENGEITVYDFNGAFTSVSYW